MPSLATGVYYVEAVGLYWNVALRRSDGQVVVMGTNYYGAEVVPPLEPGTCYVQVSGLEGSVAGRVGPTSTYVGIALASAFVVAFLVSRRSAKNEPTADSRG